MANSTEASRGIKPEITLRYWTTGLSFNFQRNISNSIIQRSMRVNGRLQNRLYHKDSCPEHIVLADSINGTQFNHFQSSPHDHDISFAEFNTECDNSYIPSSIHSYNDFTTSDIHITSSNSHDGPSPLHDPSNSPISSISDSFQFISNNVLLPTHNYKINFL